MAKPKVTVPKAQPAAAAATPVVKVTVPKVRTAPADPEMVEMSYVASGEETITVEEVKPQPPAIIVALAAKVGKTPWLWHIADDHITIIATTGQKYRFEPEK